MIGRRPFLRYAVDWPGKPTEERRRLQAYDGYDALAESAGFEDRPASGLKKNSCLR